MRIDPNLVLELAIGAAAVGGWFLLYALALLVTRPADVSPAPATQDFPGEEPPAVVSLLANRWEVTEDAAESTLIDLAARRYLEFRQPANDPMQTTIHVRDGDMSALLPYERSVYDRVRALAVGGVLPLTALTFRDQEKAASWAKRLRADVIDDARSRGLSRRRFSPAVVSMLAGAAAATGAGVALAVLHYVTRHHDELGPVLWSGIATFVLLSGIAGKPRGERHTPTGREAAARWLGLRAYLRGDESFASLPPSAVAIWDRYLSYGDALGVTRVCSAVIDLGMGNRRRVWSSFGGTWHRVRVRYPALWGRYGKTGAGVLVPAVVTFVLGVLLMRYRLAPSNDLPEPVAGPYELITYWLAVVLLVRGAYRIVRGVFDLALPVTLTGEVLWIEEWRSKGGGENRPPVPWLHYLAVDDGHDDRTTAWGMPSELAGRSDCGDVVQIKVRRWTRRVVELTVVRRGSAASVAAAEPAPSAAPGGGGSTPQGAFGPAGAIVGALGLSAGATRVITDALAPAAVAVGQVVTADEVSRAVGQPVRAGSSSGAASAGPMAMAVYSTVDGNRPVLQLMVVHGPAARLAIATRRAGQALPGIGDEAYAGEHWAAARRGDTVVMVQLRGPAKQTDPRNLYWLLATAAARLPA
jgi:Predicted membrane protein (DUF2207)